VMVGSQRSLVPLVVLHFLPPQPSVLLFDDARLLGASLHEAWDPLHPSSWHRTQLPNSAPARGGGAGSRGWVRLEKLAFSPAGLLFPF
jgi:hypothetical protein